MMQMMLQLSRSKQLATLNHKPTPIICAIDIEITLRLWLVVPQTYNILQEKKMPKMGPILVEV